ncbi:MAG: hypothetical protein K6F99_00875 [Lachnospiraceae bacterium]|nr:hypothetical protein [Lachnospiraceae bacterium]
MIKKFINGEGKLKRGEYGYLNSKHMAAAVRAGIFLMITLIFVLCARVFLKEHAPVFIVLAVISAIPSAMSVVNLVMYLRFKTGDKKVYDDVEKCKGRLKVIYDCVLTTTEKSYFVNVFVSANKNLLGYSDEQGVNSAAVEKHLNYMIKKQGFNGWTVKLFTDYDKFIERISYLSQKELKELGSDMTMLDFIREIIL